MFELPIPEDIYDYDSFSLKDVLEKIVSGLQELGDRTDYPKETMSWIKKAKKLHGMISLEIEERRAVEEFEDFCQKGEDYLKKMEANPYSSKPPEPQLRDSTEMMSMKTRSPTKVVEPSQVSTASDSSMSRAQVESSAPSQDGQSEYGDSRKSVVSSMSDEYGSQIYNRMHHAKKKKQTKKNAMFEFMKQTLEATRITNNIMAIGKSSVADRSPPQREENKEMLRRDKPSVSESNSRPPVNQKKPFVANRPIQRPDPGFNPADTRTGTFMELGGPRVENKMKPPKPVKKKSPSMTDAVVEKEEEKQTRAKSKKPKNSEEKEKEKEAPVGLKVKKEKSKEEKGTKEADTKGTKPTATLTKSKTMEEKSTEKKKEKEKVEVKPELKASVVMEQKKSTTVPGKETKTAGAESNKNVGYVKTVKNVEDNKSVSSSRSGPGSQNLIDIEEEDEEKENKDEEEEELKEQIAKPVAQQSEKKINESAIVIKEPATTKSSVQVDTKHEIKAEAEPKTNSENKGGDKLSQIEETKPEQVNKPQDVKSKANIQQDVEEEYRKSQPEIKTPQPSESHQTVEKDQVIAENKPKSQSSTTETANKGTTAFRIRMHGSLKETEKPVEEIKPVVEQEKFGSQSNQGDSESEQDKESSAKGEGEEQSASEGSATPMSSAEKASSVADKYEFRDKIEMGRVGLKQSKLVFQSPTRDTNEQKESQYETKKSELYTENTRASSNSSFRVKAELSGEFEGPKPLQERAIESRSSMGSSVSFNDSAVNKSGTKTTSLPQIDSKSKGKKSNETSPTLQKQKTSFLPPIEGNKIIGVDDIIKSHMSDVAAAKTKQVSSPTHANKKTISNPTSSAGSSRQGQKEVEKSAAAQKQAERRNQMEESRKIELGTQGRTKAASTSKPAAGKGGKAGDFPPVAEEDVVDYSNFIQSFQELFSGAWVNPNGFDYLMVMRDLFNMFTVHARTVDNMDNMLAKYKPSIAPLELGPNDLIAQNNMNHIFMYATKTNIDLRQYLERQQIFNKNVSLLQHGEDPDDQPDAASQSRSLYYRVVKTKTEVYDIVTRSFLRKRNWVELPHGMNLKTTWNLLWTWGKPQIDMNKLLVFQKVNHFPGNKGIVRKDLLKSNIERMQKLGQKAAAAFNIVPATFILPKEITKFIEVFYEHHEKEGPYNIWIVKPVGKSRGRGISLMNDIGSLKYTETIVAQKYMKNPLLLNGFKFDCRIYVLVTSMDPIEAFIYKEGFARISTVPFSTDIADLDNLFIHLTNSSVQKNSGVIDHTSSDAIVGGTKISLKTLRQRLERKGVAWDPIWNQICEIVVKSLYACQNEVNHHPNAFELFGYDIMIDSDLKCWLIEVNSSPSLERMNILDDLVKQQLVDDTIDLVAPVDFDRARLVQVLERRILEEQRCKSSINTSNNSRAQLNKDLTYILHGKKLREPGEMPAFIGNYQMIAPTEMSDKIQRLIQSYKVQYKTPMQK